MRKLELCQMNEIESICQIINVIDIYLSDLSTDYTAPKLLYLNQYMLHELQNNV